MSRGTRYRHTATIRRVSSTSDGYGGVIDAETPVATGYRFSHWHVNPWDREAVVLQKYGLEKDTVFHLGTGEYSPVIQNNDILEISATDRFRVLATNEVWGAGNAVPVAYNLILAKASDR